MYFYKNIVAWLALFFVFFGNAFSFYNETSVSGLWSFHWEVSLISNWWYWIAYSSHSSLWGAVVDKVVDVQNANSWSSWSMGYRWYQDWVVEIKDESIWDKILIDPEVKPKDKLTENNPAKNTIVLEVKKIKVKEVNIKIPKKEKTVSVTSNLKKEPKENTLHKKQKTVVNKVVKNSNTNWNKRVVNTVNLVQSQNKWYNNQINKNIEEENLHWAWLTEFAIWEFQKGNYNFLLYLLLLLTILEIILIKNYEKSKFKTRKISSI